MAKRRAAEGAQGDVTTAAVSVTELEATYGVRLPDRLRKFFESGEWRTYDGRFLHGMPGFSSDSRMVVQFTSDDIEPDFEYARDVFRLQASTHFPLAHLSEEGTYLVLVDLTRAELPVQFFDYESGPRPSAPNFEAFLSGLLVEG